MRIKEILLTLFSVIMWGASFPFLKLALESFTPLCLGAVRFFTGSIALGIVVFSIRGFRFLGGFSKRDWMFMILFGATGICLPSVFQNFGLLHTTASLTSIIQSSGPVIVVVLAWIFLNESLGIRKITGVTIAMVATFFLVTGGTWGFSQGTLHGNILVLLSEFSYIASTFVCKEALKRIDALTLTFSGIVTGFVMLALLSLLEHPIHVIVNVNLMGWASLLFLALLPGSFALLSWLYLLSYMNVSKLSVFVYLIPLVGVGLSYLIVGERITLITAIAGVATILGVALVQTEKR